MANSKLFHGDCLEVMQGIPDGSIDAIITDPPYGTTACKWDSVIPFEPMWKQLNRVIKPNGAIVLFGSEPFSSALRMSNIKNYKYDWVWVKNIPTGSLYAKSQPMRLFEIVSVFNKCYFYPIKEDRSINSHGYSEGKHYKLESQHFSTDKRQTQKRDEKRNPTNVLYFNKPHPLKSLHPTQKPVALMEYLIKTYTNENETVLDFTMGSGTTGVACKQLNRDFIGIEKEEEYFEIAQKRIDEAVFQIKMEL